MGYEGVGAFGILLCAGIRKNNEDAAAISTGSTHANVFCCEDHRVGRDEGAKRTRRNRLMPSALKAERSHAANAGSAESSMISGSIIRCSLPIQRTTHPPAASTLRHQSASAPKGNGTMSASAVCAIATG